MTNLNDFEGKTGELREQLPSIGAVLLRRDDDTVDMLRSAGQGRASVYALAPAMQSAGHSRALALPTAGAWTRSAALSEGPCDAVEAEQDGVYVFGQGRDSAPLVSQNPAHWTLGSGWSVDGDVVMHSAGTADLEFPVAAQNPIQLQIPYAVVYTVTRRAAGDVTEKLGTAGSSARTADGQYVQVLVPTISGKLIFTPSNDFVGGIMLSRTWVLPAHFLPSAGQEKALALSHIAAATLRSAPSTMIASPSPAMLIRAHWYRVVP
jgi:hypothetical protein